MKHWLIYFGCVVPVLLVIGGVAGFATRPAKPARYQVKVVADVPQPILVDNATGQMWIFMPTATDRGTGGIWAPLPEATSLSSRKASTESQESSAPNQP